MAKRWWAAVPLVAAAFAVPAGAAETCDAATARTATIAEILDAGRAMAGCVTVQGVVWREGLYPDVASIYRERRGEEGLRLPLRLPGYRPDAWYRPTGEGAAGKSVQPVPLRVAITGLVQGRRIGWTSAAAPPEDSGYYPPHDFDTPVLLAMKEAETAPDALTRLKRTDAPSDVISLSPLARGSVWEIRFAEAADRLERALRSGDEAQWAPLVGGQWLSATDRRDIKALLGERDGPFRAALSGKQPPQRVIFGWRVPPAMSDAERAEIASSPEAEALVCWSSRPRADLLWPIAAFDADNQPGRPYACARISYSVRDAGPGWRAFIERHDGGLPEPDR